MLGRLINASSLPPQGVDCDGPALPAAAPLRHAHRRRRPAARQGEQGAVHFAVRGLRSLQTRQKAPSAHRPAYQPHTLCRSPPPFKGAAMGSVLAAAEPRSTLFTGSQRVAEKLAIDLRGKVGGSRGAWGGGYRNAVGWALFITSHCCLACLSLFQCAVFAKLSRPSGPACCGGPFDTHMHNTQMAGVP